jgi:hypothetical protein
MEDPIFQKVLSDTELFANIDAFVKVIVCLDSKILYQSELALQTIGRSLNIPNVEMELPEYRLSPSLNCNIDDSPQLTKKGRVRFYVTESWVVLLRIFEANAVKWSKLLWEMSNEYDKSATENRECHYREWDAHQRMGAAKKVYKSIANKNWFMNMNYMIPRKKDLLSRFIQKINNDLQEKVLDLCDNTLDLIKEIQIMRERLDIYVDNDSGEAFEEILDDMEDPCNAPTTTLSLLKKVIEISKENKIRWCERWRSVGYRLNMLQQGKMNREELLGRQMTESDWKYDQYELIPRTFEMYYPVEYASVLLNSDSLNHDGCGQIHGYSAFMCFLQSYETSMTRRIDKYTQTKQETMHALQLLSTCVNIYDPIIVLQLRKALASWNEGKTSLQCKEAGLQIIGLLNYIPCKKLKQYNIKGDSMEVDNESEYWKLHHTELVKFCIKARLIPETKSFNVFRDKILIHSLIERIFGVSQLEWKLNFRDSVSFGESMCLS